MDEAATTGYIRETFADVAVVESSGGTFFFIDPARKFSFATLSINDEYDQFSDLSRPSVFRLNFGVSKETFRSLFPEGAGTEHDFAALDRLMPHPVYGKMYWVSVLNPSAETFEAVKPMLAEAYDISAKRWLKPQSADES